MKDRARRVDAEYTQMVDGNLVKSSLVRTMGYSRLRYLIESDIRDHEV